LNPCPVAVFLGPSLSRDEARGILDADYYPPARKGDVYRVLPSGVEAIILIDGVFHSTPSVWQRELLDAMDEEIEVLGASSMGALRAAELHPYGMIGHGTIFEWYRDGVLDGDDEVALLHGPEEIGFRPLSEPLVNIRHTLQRAVVAGCLSSAESRRLIAFAKRLYYPERSYARLLEAPLVKRWPSERVSRLRRFLSERSTDLKRLDAIGVLRRWARQGGRARRNGPGRTTARRQPASSFGFARSSLTGFFGQGGATTGEDLLRRARNDPRFVRRMRRELSRRRFLLECARQADLRCPPSEASDFVRRWEGERGMLERPARLAANGLTPLSYRRLLEERALIAWMERSGPERFGMKASFVLEWASRNGVRHSGNGPGLEALIVARGPRHFGLDWNFKAALIEELQVTGRAAELLDSTEAH
jgi:hypothetical protein